ADERVRHAVAHAIDANFVIENILYGFGIPGDGPIPHSAKNFFQPVAAKYPYNPRRAAELLDAAGFKANGKAPRFTVRMLPAPWGEVTINFGQYVKQALAEVGIN